MAGIAQQRDIMRNGDDAIAALQQLSDRRPSIWHRTHDLAGSKDGVFRALGQCLDVGMARLLQPADRTCQVIDADADDVCSFNSGDLGAFFTAVCDSI